MIHGLLHTAKHLLYDVTVGLIKDYKRTSTELAKIELATYYIRAVKLIRQECLTSTLIIFGVIMFSNMLGVVQMAIIFFAPIDLIWRIIIALLLGIIFSLIPLAVVFRLFSEDRWMKLTKANDVLEKAMSEPASN